MAEHLLSLVRLYRHKFARIPNKNLAVEVKENIAYAYAMRMHNVALRTLHGPMPEPLFGCVATTLLFSGGGDDMAKIQIITAMTMDGFLPKAGENLMQWVKNDATGFPYWHEHSVYRLMPHYPLLGLLAEKNSDKNKSDIYIAEISDAPSIELMRGLSRYSLIDEMVIYILPIVVRKEICVFDDLTPIRWNVHGTITFPNGITRIIYRHSCILQEFGNASTLS